MIPPSVFVEKMRQQWKALGNIESDALMRAWRQQCEVFNGMYYGLRTYDKPGSTAWKVLQPPTGSGKTLGLIVYAAMLMMAGREHHPGMLIVTRLIEDAKRIAERVNELSREYSDWIEVDSLVAISYHTENRDGIPGINLMGYPLLVVTHRAYALAVDRFYDDTSEVDALSDLYGWWEANTRRLIVIDEAIDIVDERSLVLRDLRNLIAFIPQDVRTRFTGETDFLKTLESVLEKAEKENSSERLITSQPLRNWDPGYLSLKTHVQPTGGLAEKLPRKARSEPALSFAALSEAMHRVRLDEQLSKRDDDENRRLHMMVRDWLSTADALYGSWFYHSKQLNMPTFNTAKLMIPEESSPAVILDATASCNVLYRLFDKAEVIQPPGPTRSYRNVTLHLSYSHKVGKTFMAQRKNVKALCAALVQHLDTKFRSGKARRKVLIVTHKNVEPYLVRCVPESFDLHASHWGEVNGSNRWKHCDTVVIFGLPYRPTTFTANVFMAFKGPQTTEWLNAQGDRPYDGYTDIREAIATGQIVTDVVQAINRVRCRNVIDAEGNCLPTDVYLLLPADKLSKDLVAGIEQQMPGIKTVDWAYREQKQGKRGVKKGNTDKSVVTYLMAKLKIGSEIPKSQVMQDLEIPKSSFDRFLDRLHANGHEDEAVSVLIRAGIDYQVRREGRTQKVSYAGFSGHQC